MENELNGFHVGHFPLFKKQKGSEVHFQNSFITHSVLGVVVYGGMLPLFNWQWRSAHLPPGECHFPPIFPPPDLWPFPNKKEKLS